MGKKIAVVHKKRGCLWCCAAFVLLCLAIYALAFVACIVAGVGLWFLVRYCWRKLAQQAPDSKFVRRVGSWPPVVRQVLAGVACAFVSLLLMGSLAPSKAPQQQAAPAVATAAASTAAATTAPATTEAPVATPALDNLVVRFVDVGQGDASIIEFPDGKTMLIDTPTGEAGTVKSQLAADGRNTIDWLVATHPDADHIGGLDTIISTMDVRSVWAPEVNSSTKTYTRFLTAIADKGLSIEPCYAGRTVASGENYTAELLWPEQGASYSEDNAYSAIIKVTYGNSTFLFTGDAPAEAQKLCGAGHVDVLKVAHHGSASGMDTELASKLTPSAAVISYGQNNYGHPTQVVLDALAGVGTHVYGTRVNGTVTAASDGTTVSVTSEREGSVEAASQDAGKSGRSIGRGSGTSSGGGSSGSSSGSSSSGSGESSGAAAGGGQSVSGDEQVGDVVYVTASGKGKRYHRKGCSSLNNSSGLVAMSRSEAESQGYAPCKRCNP